MKTYEFKITRTRVLTVSRDHGTLKVKVPDGTSDDEALAFAREMYREGEISANNWSPTEILEPDDENIIIDFFPEEN